MLQPGIVLGGIRIDSLLGRGAMGEVYLGQQVSLKRPVAVKRIAEHLLGNEEAIGRFEREAQCVARIQSPHVVAVHNFMRVHDEQGTEHALLVMELVDGGSSLRGLLANRGQAFDWRTATALILHAAEGLAAAAEHGVVHRDIKPDNIMVTRKGVAKLADFGLAKSVDSSAMTLEGTVMGTPLYLPPEACRGHPVDARGDLYSLGCTWFHLLAGRPPFQAASTVALLRAHLDDTPPDLRSLAPSVPEAIAALVHRLLAKDPAQRLPSAQALVDELHALAAQGITLPRTVAELFTVDAATTITRVADVGKTEVSPSAGGVPSSTAATLPMGSTAATVLAEPTERVEQPSALTAKATSVAPAVSAAVATPASSVVPPVTAPAVAVSTVAAPRWRPVAVLIGVAVLMIAVIAGVMVRGGSSARPGVEHALADKDYGLALQRAATNLATNPGDADAVALVREAVHAEVRALIAAGRVDDARKRVTDHRAAYTWLDTGTLDGEIAIAQAMWLATHHQEKEAVAQFAKLRQDGVDPVALDRAMVDSLSDSNRPAEAIGAAWRLAQGSTGALEPKVLQLLTYAMTWEGPFSDSMKELRTLLRTRHPPIIDTVRPWLDEQDYEKRYAAFLLLQEAGAVSDPETIRFHVTSALTLSSSYTVVVDALNWLADESAKPAWSERKAAAKLPVITEVPPLLKSWNEQADRFIAVFATAFLPEIEERAVAWSADADENLRWNALKLLIAGKRSARIDVAQFHATTLTTFNPLYESAPFTEAVSFFAAKAGTPDAPAAKAALEAGAKHIQDQVTAYEKASGNFMQVRANHCKDRLKQVQDVIAKF